MPIGEVPIGSPQELEGILQNLKVVPQKGESKKLVLEIGKLARLPSRLRD